MKINYQHSGGKTIKRDKQISVKIMIKVLICLQRYRNRIKTTCRINGRKFILLLFLDSNNFFAEHFYEMLFIYDWGIVFCTYLLFSGG